MHVIISPEEWEEYLELKETQGKLDAERAKSINFAVADTLENIAKRLQNDPKTMLETRAACDLIFRVADEIRSRARKIQLTNR